MTETPKKRFPKKKHVSELPDTEVVRRLFPKKVRDKLYADAHEKDENQKADNDSDDNH